MTKYRTSARIGKDGFFCAYHGLSFQSASEAFDAINFADERRVEIWNGKEWRTAIYMLAGSE